MKTTALKTTPPSKLPIPNGRVADPLAAYPKTFEPTKLRPRKTATDLTTGPMTIKKLDRLITTSKGALTDVEITPELAAHILSNYNTGNRKIRVTAAMAMARSLQRNGWLNTGEPLIFAAEGILNNGQHRLEAIVRAKMPMVLDLRFGIPRKAFANTDTGSKRKAGDVLAISGVTNCFASAAGLKLLLAYEEGLPTSYVGALKIDNEEILAAYKKYPEINTIIDVVGGFFKNLHGFRNASSIAFTVLATGLTDAETVAEFLELVANGTAPPQPKRATAKKAKGRKLPRRAPLKDGPTVALNTLLTSAQNSSYGSRTKIVERLAWFINAWNQWRAGQRGQSIAWTTGQPFPKITR